MVTKNQPVTEQIPVVGMPMDQLWQWILENTQYLRRLAEQHEDAERDLVQRLLKAFDWVLEAPAKCRCKPAGSGGKHCTGACHLRDFMIGLGKELD